MKKFFQTDTQMKVNDDLELIEDQDDNRPMKRRKLDDSTMYIDSDIGFLQHMSNQSSNRLLLLQSLTKLLNDHPEVRERLTILASSEVNQLTDEQLSNIIRLIQTDLGLCGPYDNAIALLKLFGVAIDKFTRTFGLGEDLLTDPDIVQAVNSLIPRQLQMQQGKMKLFIKLLHYVISKINPKPIEPVANPQNETQARVNQATKTIPVPSIIPPTALPTPAATDNRDRPDPSSFQTTIPPSDSGPIRNRKNNSGAKDNKKS